MNKKGQNIVEYSIIIGVVGSALLFMSVYFQRSIQSIIKGPADNLGGFGSGMFSPQRIQEIGTEDSVDPDYSYYMGGVVSGSATNFTHKKLITISPGGGRRVDIPTFADDVESTSRYGKTFSRIEYDEPGR